MRYNRTLLRRSLSAALIAFVPVVVCGTISRYYANPAVPPFAPSTHAWTSVDSIGSRIAPLQSYVELRQAWVRGAWMRALDKNTLLDALAVQHHLLAGCPCYQATPASDGKMESAVDNIDLGIPRAALVHSILQTWNCSASALSSDSDVLGSLRRGSSRKSPANITMRPASALSTFTASSGRIVAADAMTITLMCEHDSDIGHVWDDRAATLPRISPKWHVTQEGHGSDTNNFARVQYRPANALDNIVFLAVYGAITLYACVRLAKATIVKSRIWLFASVLAEVALATILAREFSSSIGIAVSTVPPAAYPVLALFQCLRNVLGLVENLEEICGYKDVPTRISLAIARLGPMSLLLTVQAVGALLLVPLLSPPAGLASFCEFAAVSLVFDLAAFSSLFVVVLTVNIKSLGLHDAVKADERFEFSCKKRQSRCSTSYSTHGRRDQAKVSLHPFLPSMAKNLLVAMSLICFVAWHFVDDTLSAGGKVRYLMQNRNFRSSYLHFYRPASTKDSALVQWFRAQDPRTLQEILQAMRLHTSSIVVRSHTPLSIVTELAERNASMPITGPVSAQVMQLTATLAFMPALFVVWQAYFGRVEMEDPDSEGGRHCSDISRARCLAAQHILDIYILTSCARRFLISVGFDHQIRLWNFEHPTPSSQLIVPNKDYPIDWPISSAAISDDAEWLAFRSRSGRLLVWNRRLQRFLSTMLTGPGERVVACLFVTTPLHTLAHGVDTSTRLLLIMETGYLTDLDVNSGKVATTQICDSLVRSTHRSSTGKHAVLKLITVTGNESVFISTYREGCWVTQPLRVPTIDRQISTGDQPLLFSAIPSLRGVASLYDECKGEIHLVDILSGALIYSFHVRPFRRQSFRAFHPPPQQCIYCGSMAVASFSIAYTERQDGGKLVIITVTGSRLDATGHYRTRPICLRSERDVRERRCTGFAGGVESTHSLAHPGTWEVTGANGIAGVRRRPVQPVKAALPRAGSLASRRHNMRNPTKETRRERWEAWTMTAQGITNSHELSTHLPANACGPVCRLAQNAIAVALADVIILVQFGNQLHDDDVSGGALSMPMHGMLSRRNSKIGKMVHSVDIRDPLK